MVHLPHSIYKQPLRSVFANQEANMRTHTMQKNSGFTLVEALVAISVLMVAVASPLYIAQQGLSAAVLSRDQMTASFLAQDGLEAVKNIRDDVAISQSSGSWLAGLGNCMCGASQTDCSSFAATANYCNIDTTAPDLLATAQGFNPIIAKQSSIVNPLQAATNNSNGLFLKYDLLAAPGGYTNTPSKFSRYINIATSTTNPNEAEVNVRVTWSAPIGMQYIDLHDFIYNYSENNLQ